LSPNQFVTTMTNSILSCLRAACIFLIFSLLSIISYAQAKTNEVFLQQFAQEQQTEWQAMQQRVQDYVDLHGVPVYYETPDGGWVILFDVVEGQPVYYASDNVGAAITTRANQLMPGGNTGLELTGEGYDKLGVWDGGRVRNSHVEFMDQGVSRVTQIDNPSSMSDHATHVAGTMVAAGINADARGMAYAGELKAYNSSNDNSEMTAAALNGMEISNHSYSQLTGWSSGSGSWQWYGNSSISPVEDYKFGFYGPQSRTWDVLAYNAPYYLISKSAGNNRGEGPSNAGQPGFPEKDGGEDGYDCIPDRATAKNVLAVGAISEVLDYTGPQDVVMSSFSGWGPTDDGRIKPDVVAKGVGVFSAGSNSDTHYSSKNGTSMSTPNTAGTMALLQLHYQNLNGGNPMLASTLKGLVIHSADEAGANPGPDYIFGWGLVNAEVAANIISENFEGQLLIDEIEIANGETYQRQVAVAGGNPLRVTICWTDPAGDLLPLALNDRTPVLKHDLDLRLEDGNGNTFYPWKLDPDLPAVPATNQGKNHVDNVEMVHVDMAEEGIYNIIVDHDGVLSANQVFSIIISGIDDYEDVPSCSNGLIDPENNGENAFLNQLIQWEPASFATSYDVYFGTDGEGLQTPSNILNGENVTSSSIQLNLDPLTTYYVQVIPRNNQGTNDDCSEIWTFTTMAAIAEFPYLIDAEDVDVPSLPEFWQSVNYSDYPGFHWASTSIVGASGTKSIAIYSPAGQVRSFDNWLISPPIAVDVTKEYNVSFNYRGLMPNTSEQIGFYWGTDADTNQLVNLAFQDDNITFFGWLQAEALLVPELDGHIFLAWHADNPQGIGVFLDDLMIEDWGLVGVKESPERKIRAFYREGMLSIQSEVTFNNLEVEILSASGQNLLQKRLPDARHHVFPLNLKTGIYIITLRADGLEKAIKLFVNH
jgi:hypothetical protein